MKRNTFFTLPGFTLVELLLVMAIISIVATIGVVNVVEYNRNQTFIAATNGIYSAIQLAKQRAQAQVVPSSTCSPFTGYRAQINSDGTYGVTPVCNGVAQPISSSALKKLPPGYTTNPSPATVTFQVLSGSVTEANGSVEKITLSSGGGKSKEFDIYSDGRIQ